LNQYKYLLEALAVRIQATAHTPTLAFTHIQPAEPTTIGYRLALYAQDLLNVYLQLSTLLAQLRGKGFKGAVGVGAAYGDLLGAENLDAFEAKMSARLDLPFFTIASQTYPRLQDYQIISALSGMGAVLHKFAFDLRLLQSPVFGEWSEPFGKKQVGSSAMPFKRNPINAEKIDSLARSLSVLPQVAWSNAATSLLERTLDDSANRRSDLPEAFLISDELLKVSTRLIQGFVINEAAVERNLLNFAPFSAIERILMALSAKGASRQAMHERLRQHALDAWQVVQQGQANDLLARVAADDEIRRYLSAEEISELAQVQGYIGFAPQHALKMAAEIEQQIR
jgi:adenylosuccinate lyase